MSLNINKEVAAMKRMTMAELKTLFEHVCGEPPRSANRIWLAKKIARRLQANEEGGLPERVRQFALGIANDANLRIRPPRGFTQAIDSAHEQTVLPTSGSRDQRLPPSGTIISNAAVQHDQQHGSADAQYSVVVCSVRA